jgi:hypothetical protein
MQIAAVASAIGLTGTAVANGADRTPGMDTSAATFDNGSAATINANTPGDNGTGRATMGGNESYGTSDQTGNPAADLSTNPDVNGGAGINANSDHGSSNTTRDLSGNASSSTTSDLNADVPSSRSDLNGSASTSNGSGTSDTTGQVDRGATQGSTMESPRPNTSTDANAPSGGALHGSGSSATSLSGQGRLAHTNSDNFNTWMSDYASQHNGRISRDEFLAQMGNRWDQLDAQHSGYLTPSEVDEILILTPPENAAPPRTGSDVQSGDMGPGSARSQ